MILDIDAWNGFWAFTLQMYKKPEYIDRGKLIIPLGFIFFKEFDIKLDVQIIIAYMDDGYRVIEQEAPVVHKVIFTCTEDELKCNRVMLAHNVIHSHSNILVNVRNVES